MKKIPLRDAFVKRDKRFDLLDKGLKLAGFETNWQLLEPGCAGGEAAEHLSSAGYGHITAIDLDGEVLKEARFKCSAARFIKADACNLPFLRESFDGIYSEAAFSVIPDKASAAAEYARVLKKGGRLLLNDFALRCPSEAGRQDVVGIPCLMGVQTMDTWQEIFENAGLRCVYRQDEFPEFIRLALSLSRTYGVSPTEVGKYIVSSFGKSEFVSDFFSQTSMSYCQMIFEKG